MPNPFGRTSSSGQTHGGTGGTFGTGSSSWSSSRNHAAGATINAKSVAGSSGSGSYGSGAGIGSDYLGLLRSISDANNAFNLDQVQMVNDFNAREAQKNRDWQQYLIEHAHQIEVSDLRKAGLNPVLSAGGQGAAIGSGGVASGQKAVADSVYGNGVMSLMASMISASSAQAVAKIHADAQMYGADKSYAGQMAYVNQLRDSMWTNMLKDGFKTIANSAPALIRALK